MYRHAHKKRNHKMCEYQFQYLTERKTSAYCSISSYFSHWKYIKDLFPTALAEWSSEIPIDAHGHCLFHSRDIKWKLNNHFYSRFLQLLNILSELAIHAGRADQEMVVNMRECCFVGKVETDNCQGSPIVLADLDFFQGIHLDVQHSVFEDSFCIRNAHLKQVNLDLSYCQFKDKAHLEPSTLGIQQQYPHTSLSASDQHSKASQLGVITQKINVISKRIRRTKNKSAHSRLEAFALPHAINSGDYPPIAATNEELDVGFEKFNYMENEREEFHAFLSFAEEDAETAEALYRALSQYGLNIWFSKLHLSPGESIINTINQAINNSRSGIVLISPNTFNDHKHFPRLELNSLLTRDLYRNKPFFPVYHEITPEQVAAHLILIGDRLATDTTKGMNEAARRLFEALKKQEVL